jgi:hypothetical protein
LEYTLDSKGSTNTLDRTREKNIVIMGAERLFPKKWRPKEVRTSAERHSYS